MEDLLKKASARTFALWVQRDEVVERLREDKGSVTVENVLWIAFYVTAALTVGGIIYALVIAKAQSLHF